MKLVLLDAITLGNDISLDAFLEFGELVCYESTSVEETAKRIQDAEIILTNKVVITKEHMQQNKALKLICILATGMNNVDLDAAKELGIEVKNVAGYSTKSVAQHTFSMLFYLLEQLAYYDNFTKEKQWCKSKVFTHIDRAFFEVAGKKWGIVGLGNIGREVANIATAFGAEVCYFSASGASYESPYVRCSLEELLSSCDIISIHAPLNEHTHNLLTYKELSLLKEGSILMNVGRGGIICEKDMAQILDEKAIFHATDVLEQEPMQEGHCYLSVKNKERLLMTPHIAWASKEARQKLLALVKENIQNFLKSV